MQLNLEKDFKQIKPAPALVVAAGLFLLFVALYWRSVSDLIELWSDNETYSHGFFIPILIIYLLIQKNQILKSISLTPSPIFLIPLVTFQSIWVLALLTDTRTIELTLLPFIYIFTFMALTGWQSFRQLFLPLSFIVVAIPIWGILTPLFQHMAVTANELILGLVGIPTHIKNTTVSIPAGTFEVEGGCAGIRYLVVSLALGGFYALLNFKQARPFILLALASLIIPVIFNWIRIFSIILIGHFTDMQSPLVEDHAGFGWILYAFSLIPLFIIATRLECCEENNTDTDNVPEETRHEKYSKNFAVAVSGIFLIPAVFNIILSKMQPDTFHEITVPAATAPWIGPIHMNDWKPAYKNATIEMNRLYVGIDEHPDISLHVFYYEQQDQGKELINELNTISNNNNYIERTILNLDTHKVIEHWISDNNKQFLVWHWYIANKKPLINHSLVKLNQALELFSGTISSSLIVLRLECSHECDEVDRNHLKEFSTIHSRKINAIYTDNK